MRSFFYFVLFAFGFCSSAIAGSKEDAFQVVEKWSKAFTEADVDTLVGLYSPDAVFLGTGTKNIISQPDGVRKYFEGTLLGNRKFIASQLDSSTMALNDTTVIVTALDKLIATVDGKSQAFFGRVTFVLAKRGSEWKIVSFHRSAMPP